MEGKCRVHASFAAQTGEKKTHKLQEIMAGESKSCMQP